MAGLTQSYVHGVSDTPLIGKTIGNAFDEMAAKNPGGVALIVRDQNIRWSWQELKARVDALASGLIALGLTPGQRIGILGLVKLTRCCSGVRLIASADAESLISTAPLSFRHYPASRMALLPLHHELP